MESIEKGDFPKWKLFIQIMPEKDASTYHLNPFDLTKVWPHKDYPLIEVGVMELNRNPENFFAEVEQSAFNPANVVPGISFSPDKMLPIQLRHIENCRKADPAYGAGVEKALDVMAQGARTPTPNIVI